MWTFLKTCLFTAAGVTLAAAAHAETVAMIGTGNVGAALGERFAENGHEIVYGSRDPAAADREFADDFAGVGADMADPGVEQGALGAFERPGQLPFGGEQAVAAKVA